MAPHLLFIDLDTGRVQAGNADMSAPLLLALQGTTLALRVGFISDAIPGELPAGTTGRLIAKKELDHAGEPVVFAGDWSRDDEGTNARYEFSTLVDGVGLRALLNGKSHVQLGAQIEWQVPDEEVPRKSQPFLLHVLNSYAQEEDGVPDPATAAAWEWIKARFVAGSNITLTINEEGKTITIAASGVVGGSVSWGDVSGKPALFPPSSHSHTTGELPMASQAEAEAGVVGTKLMTPLRTAQAIAALAAGGGGGSFVTHICRVYVDVDRGNDGSGMLGREDKPFATLDAAWGAWAVSDSYVVGQMLEVVLGPGEYSLTQELPLMRLRIRGAGLELTSCTIAHSAPAGTDGVYGDPHGQPGSDIESYLESDHSVFFDSIVVVGGDGGDPYGELDNSGVGGVPTVQLRGVWADAVAIKTGVRGEAGGDVAEFRACYVEVINSVIEGELIVEVDSDRQKWTQDGNEVQLRGSRINDLQIAGLLEGEGSVGFARLCDFAAGPVDRFVYTACAGPA